MNEPAIYTLDYRWSSPDYFWFYFDDPMWWYDGLAVMPSWFVVKVNKAQ